MGVSTPSGAFCDRVFQTMLRDVDTPAGTLGCDVLIVGRQQLKDTGIYTFAHDVIPRCLAAHRPRLLVPVIVDRFTPHRYARDLAAWQHAREVGVAVVVFEYGLLRECRTEGGSEEKLVDIARAANETAKTSTSPVAWLTGNALSVDVRW